jgi:rhamnose transport system permease protein
MRTRHLILLALLTLLLIYARFAEPQFVTLKTQALLAGHMWELAIVAIPMLLIVISGGIDLSIGSIVALSAVTFGLLFERGVAPFAAAIIAVTAGGVLGFINGFFIVKFRAQPLIVTLATMAAFRGIAEGISFGRPLSGYPDSFTSLANIVPAILFFAVALSAWLLLTKTVFGRWLFAIGQGERAAVFSRVPVPRVKVLLYTICGAFCGLAAMLLVARNNTAKADLATGIELEAITAVVLGGASIQGGTGSILGLLLGIALIHETREFVSWHWQRSELGLIVLGALLLLAVLLSQIRLRNRVVSAS